MANQLTTQLIIDGPRNAIVKVTAVLDTSDQALTTVVDPTTLFYITGGNKPPRVRLNHIDYSISDQLEVQTFWGGTPNQPLLPLAGRGRMSFDDFKGIPDNATAADGTIKLQTTGWQSGIQVFTVTLELIKEGLIYTGAQ